MASASCHCEMNRCRSTSMTVMSSRLPLFLAKATSSLHDPTEDAVPAAAAETTTSTASWQDTLFQRPSDATTRKRQSGVRRRRETSGSQVTQAFRDASPNARDTARQSCTRHTPLLPQLTYPPCIAKPRHTHVCNLISTTASVTANRSFCKRITCAVRGEAVLPVEGANAPQK